MSIKILASGSSGNCYLLETSKETLILECGIKYKDILKSLNFDLSKVIGCLVTHEHKDHCKAINEIISAGITAYSSQGTWEALKLNHLENAYKILKVTSGKIYKIGGFDVMPFEVEHDVNEPLGYLIKHNELGKIVFITDSYYCKYKFKDVEHVLIECNYSEDILNELPSWRARVLKSHMSLETLKETLKTWDLSKTKDITLIHISEGNGEPEKFKKEIEELTGVITYIAAPGLDI